MLKNSSGFKRIAHRGASTEAPENTLLAIRLAFEKYHVDMVEIDIRLSRDRVPVVIHDERLERTTNGQGFVREYSLERLKAWDAGYRFDPEGRGEYFHRGKGITIPTLEEVLRKFDPANFLLEIKEKNPEDIGRILSVLHRAPKTGALIVGSFYGSVMREFRRLRVSSSLRSTFARDETAWAFLFFCLGFKKIAVPSRYLSIPTSHYGIRLDSPRWISFLHRQGAHVFYWTIDDPREMEALIRKGADGIVTNYPGRLNEVVGRLQDLL